MKLMVSENGGLAWSDLGYVGAFGWMQNGCPHTTAGLTFLGPSDSREIHALVQTGKDGLGGVYHLVSRDGANAWTDPARIADEGATLLRSRGFGVASGGRLARSVRHAHGHLRATVTRRRKNLERALDLVRPSGVLVLSARGSRGGRVSSVLDRVRRRRASSLGQRPLVIDKSSYRRESRAPLRKLMEFPLGPNRMVSRSPSSVTRQGVFAATASSLISIRKGVSGREPTALPAKRI